MYSAFNTLFMILPIPVRSEWHLDFLCLLQVQAGHIYYMHDSSESTEDSFTLTASAYETERRSLPVTISVTVIPVNDEPPKLTRNTGLEVIYYTLQLCELVHSPNVHKRWKYFYKTVFLKSQIYFVLYIWALNVLIQKKSFFFYCFLYQLTESMYFLSEHLKIISVSNILDICAMWPHACTVSSLQTFSTGFHWFWPCVFWSGAQVRQIRRRGRFKTTCKSRQTLLW